MIKIEYSTGEKNGRPIDYMYSLDNTDLYAEVTIEPEDLDGDDMETSEADDRHYAELKTEITKQAAHLGISGDMLKFYRD